MGAKTPERSACPGVGSFVVAGSRMPMTGEPGSHFPHTSSCSPEEEDKDENDDEKDDEERENTRPRPRSS